MEHRHLHEENRLSWNAATEAHNSHKGDQAAFFRNGGSTLYPEEKELLGDVRGRAILHLQCNAGQDTLSLAQLGAVVTGVDISDTAIAFATALARNSGIPAAFHRADVYDYLAEAAREGTQFDVVFCSYGALCWLSDLASWARGIATVLAPGGQFVAVEFHPVLSMFEEVAGQLERCYPYFGHGRAMTWQEGVSDYVALSGESLALDVYAEGVTEFINPHPVHEFQWSIGEVVTALLEAGLTITTLKEYPYSNGWKPFSSLVELPGRRMTLPDGMPNLPLMFAVTARRDPGI